MIEYKQIINIYVRAYNGTKVLFKRINIKIYTARQKLKMSFPEHTHKRRFENNFFERSNNDIFFLRIAPLESLKYEILNEYFFLYRTSNSYADARCGKCGKKCAFLLSVLHLQNVLSAASFTVFTPFGDVYYGF